MKKFALGLLLFAFSIHAGKPNSQYREIRPANQEDVPTKIMLLVTELAGAYVPKNIQKIESSLAKEFITTDSNGVVAFNGREQSVASVKSGVVVYDAYDVEGVKVKVLAETAIATGRVTRKGKYRGQPFSGKYAFTSTWVKQNKNWQQLAEHLSEIK